MTAPWLACSQPWTQGPFIGLKAHLTPWKMLALRGSSSVWDHGRMGFSKGQDQRLLAWMRESGRIFWPLKTERVRSSHTNTSGVTVQVRGCMSVTTWSCPVSWGLWVLDKSTQSMHAVLFQSQKQYPGFWICLQLPCLAVRIGMRITPQSACLLCESVAPGLSQPLPS